MIFVLVFFKCLYVLLIGILLCILSVMGSDIVIIDGKFRIFMWKCFKNICVSFIFCFGFLELKVS